MLQQRHTPLLLSLVLQMLGTSAFSLSLFSCFFFCSNNYTWLSVAIFFSAGRKKKSEFVVSSSVCRVLSISSAAGWFCQSLSHRTAKWNGWKQTILENSASIKSLKLNLKNWLYWIATCAVLLKLTLLAKQKKILPLLAKLRAQIVEVGGLGWGVGTWWSF